MEFLVIGVVTAVNMIVIMMKVRRGRYEDAILDTALLVTVTILFAGSFGGMVVAMIASMIISIYLFANPPTFFRRALSSEEAVLLKKSVKQASKQIRQDFRERIKKDFPNLRDLDI